MVLASQEIPTFYGTQGSLPHSQQPANSHILSQMNPVHPPSNLLKLHFVVTLPSTTGSSKCSLSLRFPHQNPVMYLSSPPYVIHATSILFFFISSPERNLVRNTDHRNPLHCAFTSSVLGPNILLRSLFSNTAILRSSLNVRDQFLRTYTTTGKIIFCLKLYIFR